MRRVPSPARNTVDLSLKFLQGNNAARTLPGLRPLHREDAEFR